MVKAVLQFLQQLLGYFEFFIAEGCDRPLGRVKVVDRDEGRFSTHHEADLVLLQVLFNLLTKLLDGLPLNVSVGISSRVAERVGRCHDDNDGL